MRKASRGCLHAVYHCARNAGGQGYGPEAEGIANNVCAGRNGNVQPGDGGKYRGMGCYGSSGAPTAELLLLAWACRLVGCRTVRQIARCFMSWPRYGRVKRMSNRRLQQSKKGAPPGCVNIHLPLLICGCQSSSMQPTLPKAAGGGGGHHQRRRSCNRTRPT